jgi:hypothetical protein
MRTETGSSSATTSPRPRVGSREGIPSTKATSRPSSIPATRPGEVQPGLKNQHTDQFTVSLERELFKNFTVALTYIHRNARDMIVQWPLNQVTQQPWEYEFKTQTINGRETQLYSIVLKDYDSNGVVDGDDIRWIGNNSDYEWRNMPDIGGKKAQRLFQGVQLTFTKRYSDRWQMMGSLLFNHSSGMAGRNKRQDQDYNMEGRTSGATAGWRFEQTVKIWKAPAVHAGFEFRSA